MHKSYGSLLEELLSEGVEVEAPVSPYMATLRDIELMIESLFGESSVELLRTFPKEVGLTASEEVELHASLLESGDLLRSS